MKNTVLLIGTGLIGGSIALALKNTKNVNIIGYDISLEQLNRAKELNVIDEIAIDLKNASEQADLIVLASPVEETMKIMQELANFNLKENVLITDVGSTKREIMNLANQLWNGEITFIGGHPMAGSHKTGVESARAHLFENAFYVLTPQHCTPYQKVEELKGWLKGTKANFLVLDAEEHDFITGVVSHFPHIIAASLVKQVKNYSDQNPLVSLLAAGGFRDITRIASSSPKLWKDIVLQNKDTLLQILDDWIMEMKNVQSILQSGNDKAVTRYFKEAKEFRDAMPVRSKGAIPAYYDLFVDIIDEPGAIAKITAILAEHDINIININIIEAREGLLGVLQLSFQSEEQRIKGRGLLEEHGYQTY